MVSLREHLLDRIAGVGVADDPGDRPEDGPVDRDEDDDAHEDDRDLTGGREQAEGDDQTRTGSLIPGWWTTRTARTLRWWVTTSS